MQAHRIFYSPKRPQRVAEATDIHRRSCQTVVKTAVASHVVMATDKAKANPCRGQQLSKPLVDRFPRSPCAWFSTLDRFRRDDRSEKTDGLLTEVGFIAGFWRALRPAADAA